MTTERLSNLRTVEIAPHQYSNVALYSSLFERYARIPKLKLSILGEIRSGDVGALPFAHIEYSSSANPSKKILITAGFHGDESAGVLALLRFIEEHASELSDAAIHAFPCVNPVGFVRRDRLGSTHHDLNRVVDTNSIAPEIRLLTEKLLIDNSRFDAVLDLHEDNPDVPCDFAIDASTPDGFYLYESVRRRVHSLSEAVLGEVRRCGFPISTWKTIYGDTANNGVILSSAQKADLYDFERFSIENLTHAVVTTETPMYWDLENRVAAQTAVIRGALKALTKR